MVMLSLMVKCFSYRQILLLVAKHASATIEKYFKYYEHVGSTIPVEIEYWSSGRNVFSLFLSILSTKTFLLIM